MTIPEFRDRYLVRFWSPVPALMALGTTLAMPYPKINLLDSLATLKPGQLLEVVTDCAQSLHGIPEDTRTKGYDCLSVEQHGPLFRFLIRVPAQA